MYEIRFGAALFCSPQLERNLLSLSHVFPPYENCNIRGTSSARCPQYLGHAGDEHEPLITNNFPVWSSLAAILAAHMICLGGTFLWPVLMLTNQLESGMTRGVCQFFARELGEVY